MTAYFAALQAEIFFTERTVLAQLGFTGNTLQGIILKLSTGAESVYNTLFQAHNLFIVDFGTGLAVGTAGLNVLVKQHDEPP